MKKIVSFITVISLVLVSSCSNLVYAATPEYYWIYRDYLEELDKYSTPEGLLHFIANGVGIAAETTKFARNLTSQFLTDVFGSDDVDDIKDEIKSHISEDEDGHVVVDDDFRNEIKTVVNNFMDNNQAYAYTLSSDGNNANMFGSIDQMQKAFDKMQSFEMLGNKHNGYWMIQRPSSGYAFLAFIDIDQHPYVFLRDPTTGTSDNSGQLLFGNFFDGETNTWVSQYDYSYRWETNDGVTDWFDYPTTYASGTLRFAGSKPYLSIYDTSNGNRPTAVFMNLHESLPIRYFGYNEYSGISDILYQPYYVNEKVWNDFSKSLGDYTFDNSNVNTVTYGDITNYIDSFNNENGYPPTSPDINIHIENKNNENNNPGGGSGSGGSGSGSGDNESDSNIFDFLSRIGEVLGSLIKNLGNVLAELIEGLSEVVSSLLESIPTVFNNFLGATIGWLPSELRALISLAIAAFVIVGIVKLFRN